MSKELRFKSEILERTTSVCIVFDEFGDCIYLSPWSLLVFEWPIDKLLGENFWTTTELKSIEGVPTYKDDVVAILARESALPADYYTIEITTQSSAKKYLKLKRSLGQQDTLIIAGTEITEQIAYQNELETMSDRLAVSLESEKELNELKTRFISMVSHEFRTPLTVIMSCAAVIEQALNNNRGDIGKKYLTKINASIKTMNNLMEDVLTIGKSSQEIEEFIETDIVKFIKNSIEDIQEAYTFASKMDIVIKEPIYTFYSNETALKHIIHNLITNALKYTTNGKNAVITIEQKEIPNKAEDTMNYIVITIADKGIGIPQKDLQRVFSNFFRASNVGNIQGTGLGLHIVKQSVDNLLGTITVDSTVDVGTTFTVTLPNDVRKLLTS